MKAQGFLFILFGILSLEVPVAAQDNDETVTIIMLKAVAGLRYDQLRFAVKPGANVKIILKNEDEMAHNLVITRPGAREIVVEAAMRLGETGPAAGFIPSTKNVLWAIPVVDPGQTLSVTFTAPKKPGVYPYVCTYPGHGYVMFGAMYVTSDPMPLEREDKNIPRLDSAMTAHRLHHSGHPYEPKPPYLYRILMPDASPAAIAVRLPHKLSYCWDASVCRLRYAWTGDFIDPTDYWTVKAEPTVKILGTVFFRDKTEYPFRVGQSEKIPVVSFKGYHLLDRYPEFHYTIDGLDVYELITPKGDGSGLVRSFRIPEAKQVVSFVVDNADGVRYSSTAGKWRQGTLNLTATEAHQFTLTMTSEKK